MADITPAETLEKIYLRLALCETDAQLQSFTTKYLVELISLLDSNPMLLIQGKEILSHYNTRVRNNAVIAFPINNLLEALFNGGTLARNLVLIYLRMGRSRLSAEQHFELLPIFLNGVEKKSGDSNYCFELLSLALPGFLQLSKLSSDKWPKFSFSPAAAKVILRFFHCYVVFTVSSKTITGDVTPLSVSEHEIIKKFITDEDPSLISSDKKEAILRITENGLFAEEQYFPLMVIASGFEEDRVSSSADLALRKVDIQKCVDNPDVVNSLMDTFLGTKGTDSIPPQQQVEPASYAMKCKILNFLCRSAIAPNTYMKNMKICLASINQVKQPKLQSGSLLFLLKIIEKMSVTVLTNFGPSLFSRLYSISANTQNTQCLEMVYRCLGALGKAHKTLVLSNMNVVTELFDAVSISDEGVAYSIVETLTDWLPAFCQSDNQEVLTNLKKLVSDFVIHKNAKCRLIALKYVEALLSDQEMDIKWILLMAAGDSRDEMKKEAARLLDMSLSKNAIPKLDVIVDFLWSKTNTDIVDEHGKEKSLSHQQLTAETYHMCARYLWAVSESLCGMEPDLRIIEGDDHWMTASPKIAKMLRTLDQDLLRKMTLIVLQSVRQAYDVHFFRIAACFISVYPIENFNLSLEACAQRARDSSRGELSSCAAFVTCSLLDPKERISFYEKNIVQLEKIPKSGTCWLATMALTVGDISETLGKARELVERLIKMAEEEYSGGSSLLEGVLGCLVAILRSFHRETTLLNLEETVLTKLFNICEKIAGSRIDTLSTKARESAVQALGFIPYDTQEKDLYDKVTTALFRVADGPPQLELHLVVGVSLWDALMANYSSSRRLVFVSAEEDHQASALCSAESDLASKKFTDLIEVILTTKLISGNHHVRRASIVWLWSLIQKASVSNLSCLSSLLTKIQEGFAEGLTENDEFAQDIASKGMGIVYQIAPPEQKKTLVSTLMNSLVDGRQSSVKVTDGTVIFKEGQLGKSPDGSNLTTYKELCSLATGLNKPDLIYKFMQLAKHNAIWNSKKGAAHGFSAILEQAREELDPFVGDLVPKLFRYRYDPDAKVQQSMKSIWTALTKQKRNVVDQFADKIANELYPELTNREWRVRESACLALSDLLRGHDTPAMHEKVPYLLDIIFRVKDDVKESVRLGADKAGEAISKIILKIGQSTNKNRANEFLGSVLPTLIEKGVHSSFAPNKHYSLALLIDLAKNAGQQLKPYLAELIPCLLDAISGSEHQMLNYLAVRSNADQLEALDDARSKMARTSPMMTAVSDLLPYIDSTVLIDLQVKLCDSLRASVGTSTRAGAAQVVTQLCLRAPQLMMDNQAVCDKLFAALLPGIRDKNPSIRKNFANCLSYLAKYSTHQQMNSLMKQVTKDLISEDQSMKEASRHILRNMIANSSELITSYSYRLVPYVFLETCAEVVKGDEGSKKRHEGWSELWNELVPSTEGAVRLYRKEIIELAVDTLQNNAVWAVRAQAAKMLSKTVNLAKDISVEDADKIVSVILPLLSGRLWEGKVHVLNALGSLFEVYGEGFQQAWNQERLNEVATVVKREATKRNKVYSGAGIHVAAIFAYSLSNLEMAQWVLERVECVLNKILIPSEADSSSDGEDLSNFEKESISMRYAATHLVGLVMSLRSYKIGSDAKRTADKIAYYVSTKNLYWNSRQEMLNSLMVTMEKWDVKEGFDANTLVDALIETSNEMYNDKRKTIALYCLNIVNKIAERQDVFKFDTVRAKTVISQMQLTAEGGLTTLVDNLS